MGLVGPGKYVHWGLWLTSRVHQSSLGLCVYVCVLLMWVSPVEVMVMRIESQVKCVCLSSTGASTTASSETTVPRVAIK